MYASPHHWERIALSRRRSFSEGRWSMKGVKKRRWSDAARQRISMERKGRVPPNKGKPMSQEQREKLSEALMGNIPWNTGLKGYGSNHPRGSVWRARQAQAMRERWLDPQFVARWREAVKLRPTKPELVLQGFLTREFPDQWTYTGDGKLVIGGLLPDFCHSVKKAVIELFGDYWHGPRSPWKRRFRNTAEGRVEVYNSEGYQCLIIWEHELKQPTELMASVQRFMDAILQT